MSSEGEGVQQFNVSSIDEWNGISVRHDEKTEFEFPCKLLARVA